MIGFRLLRVVSLPVLFPLAALAEAGEDISPLSAPEKLSVGRISEEWVHASETSALIHWQTENRARSYVAFGTTEACEQKTPTSPVSSVTGLPHWTQCHRITGLIPGKKHFCRMVCLGTDGAEVKNDVKSFETKRHAGGVRVPDDVPGPPYVLGRACILARGTPIPPPEDSACKYARPTSPFARSTAAGLPPARSSAARGRMARARRA